MDMYQEKQRKMFNKVISTCQSNQAEWKNDKAFTSSFTAFDAKNQLIDKNHSIQVQSTNSVTQHKKGKHDLVIDKDLYIINRIQSYAHATGNTQLAQQVAYNKTDLNRLTEADLMAVSNNLVTIATENLAALADYSVTQATIDELRTLITELNAAAKQLDKMKLEIKNATANLDAIFEEISDILAERLDLDIEVYRKSGSDFYNQYQDARIIPGNGGRSFLVMMAVKDSVSGEPVKNATISFALNGNSEPALVKKSAEKGGLHITNLAEGKYTVTIEKTGYMTQKLTVVVVHGETISVDVLMVKG
jgi:hypothetical protein